jgi:regulator of sigma E protease
MNTESPAPASQGQAWLQTAAFIIGVIALARFAPNAASSIAFLSLLIFVHELGHFSVAKWQGMRVEMFSIGFGPPLVKIVRGGTTYQIAAIPLGGYVKPAGENPETDEQIAQAKPDEFMGRPWWSRALVVIAGPIANLIFPVLALFAVYATIGRAYPWGPPQVDAVFDKSGAAEAQLLPGDLVVRLNGQQVTNTRLLAGLVDKISRQDLDKPLTVTLLRGGKSMEKKVRTRLNNGKYLMGISVRPSMPPFTTTLRGALVLSPAEKAGFKKGDVILDVDGTPLKDGFAFAALFAKAAHDPVPVTVKRGDKTLTLSAPKKQPVPEGFADPELLGLVGLEFEPATLEGMADLASRRDKLSAGLALRVAYEDVKFSAGAIVLGLRDAVLGRLSAKDSLGGPIAILRMASQEAEKGWERLMQLMCNISLTLGLMNLLPVPMLDGATFLQCLIEGVRGKPLKLKTQAVLQNIGLTLLVTLFAFTMVNDVWRLISR